MIEFMPIKELRKLSGLSQSKFAAKYHLGIQQLQTWEQGRQKTPDSYLYLLNRVVQMDFNLEV